MFALPTANSVFISGRGVLARIVTVCARAHVCSFLFAWISDLVLEWKKNKDLEKLDMFIHEFASRRVHRATALNLQDGKWTCSLARSRARTHTVRRCCMQASRWL